MGLKKVRDGVFTTLVSYNVCSRITRIPLTETIETGVRLIFQNKPNLKISKNQFKFVISGTHVLFKRNSYDRNDGISMGSSLGPVLANLFTGFHEKVTFLNLT